MAFVVLGREHGFGRGKWSMCFSSFHNDTSDSSQLHQLCSPHSKTLAVESNNINGVPPVFCGWAAGGWSYERCCAISGNLCSCSRSIGFTDTTSAGDFIFGLKPALKRYAPTGKNKVSDSHDP